MRLTIPCFTSYSEEDEPSLSMDVETRASLRRSFINGSPTPELAVIPCSTLDVNLTPSITDTLSSLSDVEAMEKACNTTNCLIDDTLNLTAEVVKDANHVVNLHQKEVHRNAKIAAAKSELYPSKTKNTLTLPLNTCNL